MKKSNFFLVSCFLLLASFFSACESHYAPTPPIATPSESLPLYEPTVASSTTGDEYSSSGTEETSESLISANPSTIYVYGSGKTVDSRIIVKSDVFMASSTVDVWGETVNADDVASPPMVYEEDTNPNKEKIQLVANSAGGLEFWIRAGTSAGVYNIYVSSATTSLSVTITILE